MGSYSNFWGPIGLRRLDAKMKKSLYDVCPFTGGGSEHKFSKM